MAQQRTMAVCPECGAKVRKENLRGHVDKVHKKKAGTEERTYEKTARSASPRIKDKRKVSPWPAIALAALMAASSLGAYAILTMSPSNPGYRKAVIATSMGTFTMELYEDKAPKTAGNFIRLAQAGFYNGLIFHRVVANFVIQGGDPNGDGSGGSGQIVNWERTGLKNDKYTVAMARSGSADSAQDANTATSQFFVNLKDNPTLDAYTYPYVVFAKVISGQAVVDAIGQVGVNSNDKPLTPVVMDTVTITS